jgi:aryl sulfotransferase
VLGIVWIASYPKSGNTWVRFLLANYLVGPVRSSADVELAVPGYDRAMDVAARMSTTAEAGPGGPRNQPGRVYIKTHFSWGPEHPHAGMTERAIVVLRNPRDILLSSLNYHRLEDGHDGAGYTDEAYARWFIQFGGDPVWQRLYGTLEQHTASWLDAMNVERHVVRYEELKADAAGTLAGILRFLDLPVDVERIAMAARESSFERMRMLEVREKSSGRTGPVFAGKPPRPGWERLFVSEGRTGSRLSRFAPDLDRLFDERFGPLLRRLGYHDDAAPASMTA